MREPHRGHVERIVIFTSSPSDVAAERDSVKSVCDVLQNELFISERFRLEALRYEQRTPPQMGRAPQRTVETYTRPADADIVIGILWSRLGSPVGEEFGPGHETGTTHELDEAVRQYQRTGQRPVVLLYRCRRPLPPDTPAENTAEVEAYFNSFQDPASGRQGIFTHREFVTTDEFARNLHDDLNLVLQRWGLSEEPRTNTDDPLEQLAERVKRNWIDGVLTPSLEGRPAIPLPVERSSEPSEPDNLGSGHHTGIFLKAAFDQSGRRLVFAGEQGAGKTTTLLQVLDYLLQDRGPGLEVPIVVDATSWRPTQTIEQWICHELDRLYQFRPNTAKQFVKSRQLIYLVDSLDQIGMQSRETSEGTDSADGDPQLRTAFSARLLAFLDDRRWSTSTTRPPMVLCCREDRLGEFTKLFDEGHFQMVHLKAPELDTVLEIVRSDANPRGLAEKVRDSADLQDLALKPLYLQMLLSVFRHAPSPPGPLIWEQGNTNALLNEYVTLRMRAPTAIIARRFTPDGVRPWLVWLAKRQNRSPFLIELMSPTMLDGRDRQLYRLLAASSMALAIIVCACLPVAIGLGLEWGFHHEDAVLGLKIFLLSVAILFPLALIWLVPSFVWARGPWLGMCLGVIFSAVRGFSVGMGGLEGVLPAGWEAGLRAAALTLLAGTPVFVIYTFNNKYSLDTITPLTNWNLNLWRAWWCPIAGLVIGAVFWYLYGPARGITFGVVSGVLMTGFVCLQRSGFDVPDQPNQGIVRSKVNALAVGKGALFTIPLVVVFSYASQFGIPSGLENGVEAAAISVVGLLFGGVPVLQHYSLRLVCRWRGYLPGRDLVQFLDAMTEMMLLRRVGGAYLFSNDRIKTFFADDAQADASTGS